MKTDDLIAMLATGHEPVDTSAALRGVHLGAGAGMVASAVLLVVWTGLLPNLSGVMALGMFWTKLAFAASLLVLAGALTLRLARPGVGPGRMLAWLALPVLVIWLMAAFALQAAAPSERAGLVLGSTWQQCPWNITVFALPVLVGVFAGLRRMAPTRLRMAGAAAGLLAGAAGAFVYVFGCVELSPAFIGTWYVMGILIPCVLGAWLGPRLLRW